MNIIKLLSPKYLSHGFSELIKTRDRAKKLEVQVEQMYSLLMLRQQISAIPPNHLQIRVSGAYYNDFFLHGQYLLNKLNEGLAAAGAERTLEQVDTVLDFGCGCGRTLIPLSIRSANVKGIHGVDIDQEAIGWLAENYPQIGSAKVNPSWPPMLHENETFDIVYAISVFTHLPEDMEHAWLADISRVMRKGGYALLSIHGEAFFHQLSPSALQTVRDKGFFYASVDSHTNGLPQFYQDSYHLHSYIQDRWSQYFDVVKIIPQGVDKQDLVILRK